MTKRRQKNKKLHHKKKVHSRVPVLRGKRVPCAHDSGDIKNPVERGNVSFARPPKLAEFFLELLLSRREAEYLIGDLAESYVQKESKYGPAKAKVWYWRQVAGSAYPLICKAIRWGIYALGADWVRRNIR